MTTKQNDTVALTDEQNDTVALTDDQLDAVAGGALSVYTNVASMVPRETPIPKVLFPRGRARIVHPNY
jgi:hypothetical protein